MALNKKEFSQYIREFNFRELFNEMGWNNDNTSEPIIVDTNTFTLKSVAQKSAFKILVCGPTAEGTIPAYNTRKKIETRVTRLFQEHLIIYHDAKQTEQIWQLVVRQAGKPTKVTETRYNLSQDPELLFQRASGIFFELDEEENITIIDVTKRIADNFHQNAERVTKQFYEKFTKEHGSFYSFLTGIDDHIDEWNQAHPRQKRDNLNKQWYVSLMLNRLMFCYFIQKKGFLDQNRNYLRDKLKASQKKNGSNKFYSFYRDFLIKLFHKGLGEPDRNEELKAEIGRIPYLNGGLFDEHELERDFGKIEIEDAAFERIFDFFDQYEWHLDTRVMATGRDINPDVIGYIFEKYINDRAQMGAYYTKEDITGYISRNCILPFLFEETKRNYPKAFAPDAEIYQALKASGDLYIYDAVKYGVDEELPDNIARGLDTSKPDLLQRREDWNKPAPVSAGLPTEIWREVIDRRKRYAEVRAKIENGEITGINDFITYNLNVCQFAQDAVENTNDPKFLETFYKALNNVTIIDPTCGSGAFLFAAMNILEELYAACILRMRNFIEDEDRQNAEDKKTFSHKLDYFRVVLKDIQSPAHPNLEYFIYKSIILNNLYGVDIMKEAVEIAKLRLFLKLVATVDADYRKPNLGLEPLPDIDFNIRAGNTLIGFANEADLDGSLKSTVEGVIAKPSIMEKMEMVAMAYSRFKDSQVTVSDYRTIKVDKRDLNDRLRELNYELNQLLHKQSSSEDFDDWLETCQPFHWLAEYYEIIHDRSGFDVIIGNPPYLELNQIRYYPRHLRSFQTGAVHAMCVERSLQILGQNGMISMIVPLAIVSTQRMKIVQDLLENSRDAWYSNYAWRPAKLFDTVNRALTIFVSTPSALGKTYSNHYQKWTSDTRDFLINSCYFVEVPRKRSVFWIPKLGTELEKPMLEKCLRLSKTVSSFSTKIGDNRIYYRTTGGLYWKVFTDFAPAFNVNAVAGHSTRETSFRVGEKRLVEPIIAILSSNTFWWWYTIASNLRDLNPADIQNFPIPTEALHDTKVIKLGGDYLEDLDLNSTMLVREQKQTGTTETQSFKIQKSKPILDEIDKALAKHYGFTDEELDFIINYDIKYRMGKGIEGDTEEAKLF